MSHYEGDLRVVEGARYAIVASRWNPRITDALVAGARKAFADHGVAQRLVGGAGSGDVRVLVRREELAPIRGHEHHRGDDQAASHHGDRGERQRGSTCIQSDQQDRHRRNEDAEHRNEAADEHDHRQGDGQRHLSDHQEGADEHRVDEGHQSRAPHVATQNCRTPVDGLGQLGPTLAAQPAQDEVPHGRAVLEEEEQEHDHEHRTSEELGRGGEPGERSAGDRPAGEEVPDLPRSLVDSRGVDRQRPGSDEVLQLGPTLTHLGAQRVPLAADGQHDAGQDPAEEQQDAEEGSERGEQVGPALAFEPLHHRRDGSGQDQRHQEGDHDHLYPQEHPYARHGDGGEKQGLSGSRAGSPQPVGPRAHGGGERLRRLPHTLQA